MAQTDTIPETDEILQTPTEAKRKSIIKGISGWLKTSKPKKAIRLSGTAHTLKYEQEIITKNDPKLLNKHLIQSAAKEFDAQTHQFPNPGQIKAKLMAADKYYGITHRRGSIREDGKDETSDVDGTPSRPSWSYITERPLLEQYVLMNNYIRKVSVMAELENIERPHSSSSDSEYNSETEVSLPSDYDTDLQHYRRFSNEVRMEGIRRDSIEKSSKIMYPPIKQSIERRESLRKPSTSSERSSIALSDKKFKSTSSNLEDVTPVEVKDRTEEKYTKPENVEIIYGKEEPAQTSISIPPEVDLRKLSASVQTNIQDEKAKVYKTEKRVSTSSKDEKQDVDQFDRRPSTSYQSEKRGSSFLQAGGKFPYQFEEKRVSFAERVEMDSEPPLSFSSVEPELVNKGRRSTLLSNMEARQKIPSLDISIGEEERSALEKFATKFGLINDRRQSQTKQRKSSLMEEMRRKSEEKLESFTTLSFENLTGEQEPEIQPRRPSILKTIEAEEKNEEKKIFQEQQSLLRKVSSPFLIKHQPSEELVKKVAPIEKDEKKRRSVEFAPKLKVYQYVNPEIPDISQEIKPEEPSAENLPPVEKKLTQLPMPAPIVPPADIHDFKYKIHQTPYEVVKAQTVKRASEQIPAPKKDLIDFVLDKTGLGKRISISEPTDQVKREPILSIDEDRLNKQRRSLEEPRRVSVVKDLTRFSGPAEYTIFPPRIPKERRESEEEAEERLNRIIEASTSTGKRERKSVEGDADRSDRRFSVSEQGPDSLARRSSRSERKTSISREQPDSERRMSSERRSSSERRPSDVERRPSGSDKMPSDAERRPSGSDRKPRDPERRQSGSGERPRDSERRPSSSERRPSGSERRPSGSERRPSSSERKMSGTERRPSGPDRQSTSSERRSSSSERRPSGSKRRPSGERRESIPYVEAVENEIETFRRLSKHPYLDFVPEEKKMSLTDEIRERKTILDSRHLPPLTTYTEDFNALNPSTSTGQGEDKRRKLSTQKP